MQFILDIGGEGRYPEAWNLNPSPVKTLGAQRGEPIPRLILGRADAIPLANGCVDRILVERTPLRETALWEISRVTRLGGMITLRHALRTGHDRHRQAKAILSSPVGQRVVRLWGQWIQESEFVLDKLVWQRRLTRRGRLAEDEVHGPA